MHLSRRNASVLFLLSIATASLSWAQPLPPGRIVDPDLKSGFQFYMDAAYNAEDDNYMLAYAGAGIPFAIRLAPDGSLILPQQQIAPPVTAAIIAIAHNPDRNEYLYVYRTDAGQVYGRYLANDGTNIGSSFFIDQGSTLDLAYGNGVYVLALQQGGPRVSYFALAGDSTASTKILTGGTVQNGGYDPTLAYGSVSDQFLIAFSQEFGGGTRANVNGKLLGGNGTGLSGPFGIATGFENQQGAEVGYSSSNDRFLVTFEAWERVGSNSADIGAHYVDSNGAVGPRFYPIVTGGAAGWDQPGPVTYNSSTDTFVVTSFYATIAYYREVDPVDQSLGPLEIAAFNPSFPTAATARPDPVDPQALVLTRTGNGLNGVHAHIVHLPAPPPSFSSNVMPDAFLGMPYAEMLPIVGGKAPLTYELVSGPLPSGLSGPNLAGQITGTPTAIETRTFTVKATDDEGRSVTGDVTLAVKLSPPTPTAPIGGAATNDHTPTFAWNAPPSAGPFTYNLRADNVTTGVPNVVSQDGLATTGFTPSSPLPHGDYSWRVQAVKGGNVSPFSANQSFELDAEAPAPLVPTATVPAGLNLIPGLTAVSSSGELSTLVKENAVDGNVNTFWAAPFRSTPNVDEHIAVDLGSPRQVGQVRLHPRSDTPAAFPRDFEILVSPDGVSFMTVQTVSDFVAGSATWFSFDVSPPATARYVRIRTTEANLFGSQYNVQIAEIRVYEAALQFGTIRLDWTAPPEDDTGGPVAELDIRYRVGTSIGNFGTATQLAGEPAPAPPGTPQSMTVTGLLNETTYTFAGRAIDNAGNVSPVSASATATTIGVPPSQITDLAASNPGLNSVKLTWTAPPEDGGSGGAVTSYEVRYSTSPINAANFDSATLVTSGLPSPPSAPALQEMMTVSGLSPTMTYYFGVRSVDDVGNLSSLSNVVSGSTLDGTPPNPVGELTASATASSNLNNIPGLTIAGSSGSVGSLVPANAVDGDLSTIWASPFRATMTQEFITADLGSVQTVGRVRLRSRADVASAFPRDFHIQVSQNNATFTTIHSVQDFTAATATWYEFDFAPASARYVRILVTESNLYGSQFNVQLAEIQVYQVQFLPDGILVQWDASGDDGNVGTATSYQIRYATFPIDAGNFGSATPLTSGVPAPEPPGTLQSVVISGLGPETLVYVGIKVIDDAGNASDLAVTSASTQGTPPDPVTTLEAISSTGTSVRLRLTATADDGSAGDPATSYDVRVSTAPITTMARFNAAAPAPAPAPAAPGVQQQFDVTGLSSDVLYYFAVVVVDDVGNKSPLSNLASRATLDVIDPEQVTSLSASLVASTSKLDAVAISASSTLSSLVKENTVDGDLSTFWSTQLLPGQVPQQITLDLGSVKTLSKVRLHPRMDTTIAFPRDFAIDVSTDNASFTTVHAENDFNAPTATWYDFTFTPIDGRYVRIQVTEMNLYGSLFAAMIAEIEVHTSGSGNIEAELTWEAPGDNLDLGTATSYTVAYSLSPSFSSPVVVPGAPTPGPAGTEETFLVGGLPGETTVHFGVFATDDAGNDGPLSNLPSVLTPGVAPAAVTDLTATTVDEDSISLQFSRVGDDGTGGGAATAYDVRYAMTPINSLAAFNAATPVVSGVPAPAAPPGQQSFPVNGLNPDTTYHFAVRVSDDVGNLSPVSNNASAKTADGTGPAPITDLAASPVASNFGLIPAVAISASTELASLVKENATDGNLNTIWGSALTTAPQVEQITVDLGTVKEVGRVRLHPRLDTTASFPSDFQIQLSFDSVSFVTVHTETDFVAGAAMWYTFDFPKANARYVRILITEPPQYGTRFTTQLAEIEVYEALPGGIQLTWTATGDNGGSGTAASYEIRYSASPIPVSQAGFDGATPAPGTPPTPQAAGGAESFSVTGLAPGTYYFIIRVVDESGNAAFSDPIASATIAP